jgi:hypothetical protein
MQRKELQHINISVFNVINKYKFSFVHFRALHRNGGSFMGTRKDMGRRAQGTDITLS